MSDEYILFEYFLFLLFLPGILKIFRFCVNKFSQIVVQFTVSYEVFHFQGQDSSSSDSSSSSDEEGR